MSVDENIFVRQVEHS